MSLEQELLHQIDEDKSGAENKRAIVQTVHQRERGMWSFLTWSFFLSQLVSHGVLSTGAAKAANGAELASGSEETGSDKAMVGSLSSASDEATATDETPAATTPTIVSGPQGEVANLEARVAVVGAPDAAANQRQEAVAEVVTAASGGAESDVDGDGCGCPTSHHVHADQEDLGDRLVIVGSDSGDSIVAEGPGDDAANPNPVELVTDDVLPPVTEIVGDLPETVTDDVLTPILDPVGGLLDAVADDALTPVLDPVGGLLDAVTDDVLTPVLDPVGGLLDAVANDVLTPVLDPVGGLLDAVANDVLTPVLDPVGDLLQTATDDILSPVVDPATELLASFTHTALSPVAEPVLEIVSDISDNKLFTAAEPILEVASAVTDPILSPVKDVLEPVTEPLSAALDPVTDIASPVLDPVSDLANGTPLGGLFSKLLGGSDTGGSPVSSGETMEFASPPPDTENDLFRDGGYTPYGLALQTDGESETGSAFHQEPEDGEQFALTDLFDTDGTGDEGALNLGKLVGSTGHHLTDGLFA